MTRFKRDPSADYTAAVAALRRLPTDERGRAFAESVADDAKRLWMEREGVKASSNCSLDWLRLVGRRASRDSLPPHLPGQDHAELFVKDGKAEVFTFQPYQLCWDTLEDLVEACRQNGLQADVTTWPAWHYPGSVLFVEVRATRRGKN